MASDSDYANEYEQWASYVRTTRNDVPNEKTYLYDKFARELLNYIRTHKFKEPNVFLQQSGKEYPAMVTVLETYSGGDITEFLTSEMLQKTYSLAQAWKRLYVRR
jgi:hypothetical protein